MRLTSAIAVFCLLAIEPLAAVATTSSNVEGNEIAIAQLEPINTLSDEEIGNRCYSLTMAVIIYRMTMRDNPVHGKRPDAGKNLDWVDGLQRKLMKADEGHNKGSTDYLNDYMRILGTINRSIDLSKFPQILADKAVCQVKFGTGDE